MTQLNLQTPVLGNNDQTEESKVISDFQAIQSVVNGNLDLTNLAAAAVTALAVPSGSVFPFVAAAAPTGYLLCQGQAVSRATYSTLYNVIGTAYGAGDGSSTFNVPDLQGRVPVGLGTHADVNALNRNDGAALASRTPRHFHNVVTVNDGGSPLPTVNGRVQVDSTGGGTVAEIAFTPSGSFGRGLLAGPNTANPQDTPAFVVVNFIIKT